MNQIFTLFIFLFSSNFLQAQTVANSYPHLRSHASSDISKVNLNGQWRGHFNETTPNVFGFVDNSSTRYVLELDIKGNMISGYSYTYFSGSGAERYYTICRITGTVDRKQNYIVVTEVERIKFNTPPEITNCFQIHRLRYIKGEGNTEYLKGDWLPAPNQSCSGKGETELSREVASRTPFSIKLPSKKQETAKKPQPATKPHTVTSKPAPSKPLAKVEPEKKQEHTKTITTGIPTERETVIVPEKKQTVTTPPPPVYRGYENRKNIVAKSINIENPVFQVDFYDNGEIDGDSISVFYNGKLVVSHKMLTDKPLTLTLSIDKDYTQNVITMYAENLGSIPPNTAVMIVRDGNKRYEVRMESDLGKSGTVVFTHDGP